MTPTVLITSYWPRYGWAKLMKCVREPDGTAGCTLELILQTDSIEELRIRAALMGYDVDDEATPPEGEMTLSGLRYFVYGTRKAGR